MQITLKEDEWKKRRRGGHALRLSTSQSQKNIPEVYSCPQMDFLPPVSQPVIVSLRIHSLLTRRNRSFDMYFNGELHPPFPLRPFDTLLLTHSSPSVWSESVGVMTCCIFCAEGDFTRHTNRGPKNACQRLFYGLSSGYTQSLCSFIPSMA